jgi:hypothetical protein
MLRVVLEGELADVVVLLVAARRVVCVGVANEPVFERVAVTRRFLRHAVEPRSRSLYIHIHIHSVSGSSDSSAESTISVSCCVSRNTTTRCRFRFSGLEVHSKPANVVKCPDR